MCISVSFAVSSVCNSAPGSGPSSPNSSNSTIAENGFTGSVPNIHTEVCRVVHTPCPFPRPHGFPQPLGAWETPLPSGQVL